MTPEQSDLKILDPSWLTTATADDLARIDELRAQNRSPGASVARFMIEEIEELEDLEKAKWVMALEPSTGVDRSPIFEMVKQTVMISDYLLVPYAFLEAEEVVSGGEVPVFGRRLLLIIQDLIGIAYQLNAGIKLDPTIQGETHAKQSALVSAAYYPNRRKLAQILDETNNPLKVVDYFVDYQSRDEGIWYPQLVENARIRFRSLSATSQQELPPPSMGISYP